jgi:uncharacterized protein (TIGR03083 family)
MDAAQESIRRDSARVADLIGRADLDSAVPGCPEWNLRQLVQHLGEVQHFWAENVMAQDASTPWPGEVAVPERDIELEPWLRGASTRLLSVLAGPEDAPCWTWWGEPATLGAVARHQVQEAAVHRWDAESACGRPNPIEPEVAHDGVAEFIEIVLGTDAAGGLPSRVTLTATDTGGHWTVGPLAGSGKGATVEASASDLVLLLYGRLPLSTGLVSGDAEVADALFEAVSSE